jgi:hypothetical protein
MKYEGHTPGPWELDDDFVYALNEHGHNKFAIHCGNSHCKCGCNPRVMKPEHKANAKLIADAPMLASQNERMLAQLKMHCELCRDLVPSLTDKVCELCETRILITEIEEEK